MSQVDASDQRIGQRIGQEYLGAAPRVAAQAGVDRQLTRLDTFKVGAEVRRNALCAMAVHSCLKTLVFRQLQAQRIFVLPL